jgi:hypothetical protein
VKCSWCAGVGYILDRESEDYVQTAVDPSDDMTIWYVGDYLRKDAKSYSTRIGAFRLDNRKNGK